MFMLGNSSFGGNGRVPKPIGLAAIAGVAVLLAVLFADAQSVGSESKDVSSISVYARSRGMAVHIKRLDALGRMRGVTVIRPPTENGWPPFSAVFAEKAKWEEGDPEDEPGPPVFSMRGVRMFTTAGDTAAKTHAMTAEQRIFSA